MAQAHFEKQTWLQVREDVAKVNPELASVIDSTDPGRDMLVYRVAYPYGSEILKEGKFYLPDKKGGLISISETSSEIANDLNYNLNSNPMSLSLKNTMEIFTINKDGLTLPYSIVNPGSFFGTWRILSESLSGTPCFHPAFKWDLTAGGRSVFLLPKVTEFIKHNRLMREMGLSLPPPKNFNEHWNVFKAIVNQKNNNPTWQTELLLFSKKWIDEINTAKYKPLLDFMLRQGWRGSEFWRNQFLWDLIYYHIQENTFHMPNPYITNTVKHLLMIAVGALPGFSLSLNNKLAPVETIQDAYLNYYELKDYFPTIMEPAYIAEKDNRPVYYSLQYPALLQYSPKSNKHSSAIHDLELIKNLLDEYLIKLSKPELNLFGTPYFDLGGSVRFNFYHSKEQKNAGIISTKELSTQDRNFDALNRPVSSNYKFPSDCSFICGCVKISKVK